MPQSIAAIRRFRLGRGFRISTICRGASFSPVTLISRLLPIRAPSTQIAQKADGEGTPLMGAIGNAAHENALEPDARIPPAPLPPIPDMRISSPIRIRPSGRRGRR